MFDLKQLDNYFNADAKQKTSSLTKNTDKHSSKVKRAKLVLPSIAAVLIGVLLAYPSIKKDGKEFEINITLPKKGELEKLHVENTVFYITDKDNKVNNFVASNIDETSPGSKLIKLSNPEGILPLDGSKWVNIKAPSGLFNQNTNLLELQQNVEIFYSEGMNLSTSSAFFDFNTSKGYGTEKVTGNGFMGAITSEGFEFLAKKHILIFNGHTNININEESFKK